MKTTLTLAALLATIPAGAQTPTYTVTPGYVCPDGSAPTTIAASKAKLKELNKDGASCSKTITIKLPKPSPTPTPIPSPSPTPTASPTPSPSPTASPTPSPTSSPAPTPAPSTGNQGPVLVSPVTQPVQGSRTLTVATDAELLAVASVLQCGDALNIQYKPTPYKVKFGIRGNCTADKPIVVNGVTDAQGNRPALDFKDAKTAPAPGLFSDRLEYGESLGGIVILRGQNDDWNTYKPRNIKIANLELKNAKQGNSYVAQNGASTKYGTAACVYILRGADITLENLVVTQCSFGLFVMAKGEVLLEAGERITLRTSWFQDNGVPGSWFEHGAYYQSSGALVEGNYFGRVVSGSNGSSFKDRSSGLIFRNNYVVSSSRAIDLVHSEEQSNGIAVQPNYGTDCVYNNTIINDGSYAAIHYGADNIGETEGATAIRPSKPPRKNLYFWNNTLKYTAPGWRVITFDLSYEDTIVNAWDNKIELGSQTTNHFILEWAGTLNLYSSNTITGPVQYSGRDGSNPAFIKINKLSEPKPSSIPEFCR